MQSSISLRHSPTSGRPETTRKIMTCDCLPIVGVLLSEILKCQNFQIEKNSQRNHSFSGGQSGRPDLELCLRLSMQRGDSLLKPSLRVTVTLKGFGQRPIRGASILVNRTRSKQLFHTSQNRPSFCAFYWVTTFSSAKRVSGWPRERNIGGVTGELRRLGLRTHRFYV